jgi:hypothetical protein
MKLNGPIRSALLSLAVLLCVGAVAGSCAADKETEPQYPVTFSDGHEIGEKDFGRPVALIAAGLGVKPDVFREAFSGVTPARGRGPSGDEARKNKSALLKVLAPHGVTNERLDEVSNYYRFRPQNDELWPTKPAKAHAVVVDGQIKKIVVTEAGSGYNSPPTIEIKGFDGVKFKVKLGLSKDLKKNGSITAIEVQKEEAPKEETPKKEKAKSK